MGFFKNKNEAQPLPEGMDFNALPESAPTLDTEDYETEEQAPTQSISSKTYSIDDAITLIHSFPFKDKDRTLLATIIKRTLESVDVHFSDIVVDAEKKESSIIHETQEIKDEISELTQSVELLKEEQENLESQLEETIAIREFLQEAQGMDIPSLPPESASTNMITEWQDDSSDESHNRDAETKESNTKSSDSNSNGKTDKNYLDLAAVYGLSNDAPQN